MGRFKQLLIKEGRGFRTMEKTNSQEKQKCNPGARPCSASVDIHNVIFKLLQVLKAHQMGEVKGQWRHAADKHVDPRLTGTIGLMMLSPICLNTKQSKECPWADHSLFGNILTHYSKTSHYPFQVRTHSFEDISPLYPTPLFTFPGKAIKLFFSTSPKTLSLRFDSVSGYRG